MEETTSSTSALTFPASAVLLFANARNKVFQYDNFKEANDDDVIWRNVVRITSSSLRALAFQATTIMPPYYKDVLQ